MTNDKKLHKSVLLDESLHYLNIDPKGRYLDCTLGEGGHSYEILKRLAPEGSLLSTDRDKDAIEFVRSHFASDPLAAESLETGRWEIIHSNFSEISRHDSSRFNGILMDLGISSRQLEASSRGFSYMKESEDIDMRMDTRLGVKAKDLLILLNEIQLTQLFQRFGEERFARKIAHAIKARITEIETVGDLNKIINRAVPASTSSSFKHPSRRVFQALRIVVNDELGSLEAALRDLFERLESHGRIVVITFHSLEDRIVKNYFKEIVNLGKALDVTKEPITPSEEELRENNRARSAKLRCVEKI